MKKHFVIIIILLFSTSAFSKSIDFEKNAWLSKISFTGMRDYLDELDIINRINTSLFIEADGILLNSQSNYYTYDTYWGTYSWKTNIMRGNLILNWAWPEINKDFKFTIFGINSTANMFGLSVYYPSITDYVMHSWVNSYLILCGRIALNSDYKLTLGIYWRNYPKFSYDISGNQILGEGGDDFEDKVLNWNYFINAELYGYYLHILLNTANLNFDSIMFRKPFDLGDNNGIIELETSYTDYLNTLRLGAQYKKFKVFDWLSLDGDIFMNVYKKGEGPSFAYAALSQNFNVFKIDKKGSEIKFRLSESITYDVFNKLYPGVYAEIGFDKILNSIGFGYASLTFNAAYNYYKTLYFCPLSNDFLYSLKLTVSIGN